jgi:hypothetical protein
MAAQERVCCLLVLNIVSSTPPCIRQPGMRIRVLGVCDRVQVCTQAIIGFLAFELPVNNASSDTLAFSANYDGLSFPSPRLLS